MKTLRVPSILGITDEDLKGKFRHRAALIKGGKVLGFGESTLGGCRYLNGHMGRSCHAEVNACKMLPNTYRLDSSKVAKNSRL